jgi:hypothetical protein
LFDLIFFTRWFTISDEYVAQAFLVIILCGVASSWLVLPPNKVIRGDGTLVKLQAASSLRDEIKGMLKLFTDWRMLGGSSRLECKTK